MRCAGVKPLLYEYLEGALTAGEKRAVEAHLGSCARCRGELDFLKRYRERTASLEPVKAPRDFTARLMRRLACEEAPCGEEDGAPLIAPWKLRLSLGVAGVLAAAVVVVLFVPDYRARETREMHSSEQSRSLPLARVTPAQPEGFTADDRLAPPAEKRARSLASLRRQTGADALPLYDIALMVSPGTPRLEAELDSADDRGVAANKSRIADETLSAAKSEEKPEAILGRKLKAREDRQSAARKDALALKEKKQALNQAAAVKEIIESYGGTVTNEELGVERNVVQSKIPARNLAPIVKKLGAIGTVQKQQTKPPAKSRDMLLNITITEKK